MIESLIKIYDNLFSPIQKRRVGHWKKPLANAKELVHFARSNDGDLFKTVEVYSNINEESNLDVIFLDFDLTNKQYLKAEKHWTEEAIKELAKEEDVEHNKELQKAIDKYVKFSGNNDKMLPISSFIDKLTDKEASALRTEVKKKEAEEVANLNDDKAIAKFYYEKIEQGYLKAPFKEAITIAKYFEERSVKCVLNWSGRHGLHLRIPINKHTFKESKMNSDITLFLTSLANLLELHVLGMSKPKTSTLDYNVIRSKGMQRLPCSKHNVSKLYANFIDKKLWSEAKYIEATDLLEESKLPFVPSVVDKEANTKAFFNLPIVKEAIATATPKTTKDNYKHEGASPNYHFTSDNKDLKEEISKVYVEGQRNVIGYRFVHLLRRSGYAKEEVEAIFRELHTSEDDFKETIQGSINSAYSKDISKLGGLKHLIDGIEEVASEEDKNDIISYFKQHFSYYDKPSEDKLEPLHLQNRSCEVKLLENKTSKWLEFSNVADNIDLDVDIASKTATFKDHETNKPLAIFEFTFNKHIFKVSKNEWKSVLSMLSLEDDNIELDDLLIDRLRIYMKGLSMEVLKEKQMEASEEIKCLFEQRKNIEFARKELGHYLRSKGMILRNTINTPYFLDKASNGYKAVNVDDIISRLNEVFEEDSISTKDVEEALTFIGDRRKPQHNIVQFSNCIYSMDTFEELPKEEEAQFTLTQTKYRYNPNALADIEDKPLSEIEEEEKLVRYFLYTSLAKEGMTEEEVEETVEGFLQMVGYMFVSGNKESAFFLILGIGGSGKSLATNLITEIFGTENVGGLSLQQMTVDNKHATSSFLNKKINIIRDSSARPIEDVGLFKQTTGYEDLMVEPKGKDHLIIPKEEVPHQILACNTMPPFKEGVADEIVERLVIFEFPNKFRKTEKVRKDLFKEIVSNAEEIEWLIYHGIEAYRKMVKGKEDFKARVSEIRAREILNKHTEPIAFILPKLIKEYNPQSVQDGEELIFKDELEQLIRFVARKEGLAMPNLDNDGKIKDKVLINKIRDVFDLHEVKMLNSEEKWTTRLGDNSRNGQRQRYYPFLVKTSEFEPLFKEMKKEEEKNKQNK